MQSAERSKKWRPTLKEEITKALTSGFTPEELATAKKTYFQDQQVARSQDRNLAEGLAQNAQYGRTMARDAAIDAKIAALTPADISAALKPPGGT